MARELGQQAATVLVKVEAGESVTITKDGRLVVVLRPYREGDESGHLFRTDPMGHVNDIPAFRGEPGLSLRADDYLQGFGEDA